MVQDTWGRAAEAGQDHKLTTADRLARADNGATQATSGNLPLGSDIETVRRLVNELSGHIGSAVVLESVEGRFLVMRGEGKGS